MWCCSGPSLVCPLPFWPLPDTELLPYVLSRLFLYLCTFCSQELLLRYNRQGRTVQNLKSKCNTRTQKRTQYRDQKLAYCAQREQQCDERTPYVSPYRGPQLLATPDGLQPPPGGGHNLTLGTGASWGMHNSLVTARVLWSRSSCST